MIGSRQKFLRVTKRKSSARYRSRFSKNIMIYLKGSKIKVENPVQVAKVFQSILCLEDEVSQAKEHFYVMHLDIRSQIKMVELVSLGTLTSSLVHPRETFRRAIMQGSASIMVAHNHPSGEPDPSDEDIKVTKALFEAGRLLGIDVLDHIIFTAESFYSFKDCEIQKIKDEKD
jgi:DNA repair protein RadC